MFEEYFSNQKFEEETDYLPLISIEEEEEPDMQEDFPTELPILSFKKYCFISRDYYPHNCRTG